MLIYFQHSNHLVSFLSSCLTQSASNADKGGQWRKERAFIKMMRQELREHREILAELIDYAQILYRQAT